MDFHKALHTLTNDLSFKHWHKEHAQTFLAHGFLMLDEANKDTWQIGFYDEQKQRMTTFLVNGNKVEHTDEQEILQGPAPIQKLNPSEVKIEAQKAIGIANDLVKKEYGKEMILKHFFVIQHAEEHTIYNVTYFTQSFKTINIKINAENGEILKHNIQALADFA